MRSSPDPAAVRGRILRWYARSARAFPWRATRDPYRILLSEFMLQQTQAARAAARLPEFLREFPDLQSLARAPRDAVMRAWRGLGYNNRAVRLHAAAREIAAAHAGRVPSDPSALRRLPGIGRYTAHAVACFAHGRRVPVVDVNVRRVLSRVFRRMENAGGLVPEREAWSLAGSILPARPYRWNQALMDFGALVCTARSPRCGSCPVRGVCRSAGLLRNPARPARRTAGEPAHRGVPRRVWRGRVVEALRRSKTPVPIAALGGRMRLSGPAPSVRWIREVVGRLERDGVVSVRRRSGGLSVCLAS